MVNLPTQILTLVGWSLVLIKEEGKNRKGMSSNAADISSLMKSLDMLTCSL